MFHAVANVIQSYVSSTEPEVPEVVADVCRGTAVPRVPGRSCKSYCAALLSGVWRRRRTRQKFPCRDTDI